MRKLAQKSGCWVWASSVMCGWAAWPQFPVRMEIVLQRASSVIVCTRWVHEHVYLAQCLAHSEQSVPVGPFPFASPDPRRGGKWRRQGGNVPGLDHLHWVSFYYRSLSKATRFPHKDSIILVVVWLLSRISLWLHGLQPARLLCPWNSPGKSTRMGSLCLL